MRAEPLSFVVEHPSFGRVVFDFDDGSRSSGFALTEGFVYFGTTYPSFSFSFQRRGDAFIAAPLNGMTRLQIFEEWRTVSEIAPPAFRSFVLSKAKELASYD